MNFIIYSIDISHQCQYFDWNDYEFNIVHISPRELGLDCAGGYDYLLGIL